MYDIAIIGAGPAGSVFAAEISKLMPEYKILIVDGQGQDNKKVCGGLLAPDAQKELSKLNLTLPNHILADPQIFEVETIDLHKKIKRYYQRHYLNMDRYSFDRWLFSFIPDSVDVLNGRCLGITEGDKCYNLKIKGSNTEYIVSTKILVGADGGNSIVRRTFFKDKLKKYTSIQQWFVNEGKPLPYYSCIFDKKTSDSCSWTIYKDKYVIFGGAFESENCRKAYDEQKKRLENYLNCSFGAPIKTEACLLSSPRRWKDFITGKDNIFLLGEAAGFISSSSFEGISSAMLSGKILASSFTNCTKIKNIQNTYKRKALKLKIKLFTKIIKRCILCSPFLRYIIMKSGITSVNKY